MLEDGTKDKNYYVNESIGISIGFLINAIRNAGLASLTYTPAPPTFLRDLLGRPEGETPVMVLVVGKPDPDYELPTLRKKRHLKRLQISYSSSKTCHPAQRPYFKVPSAGFLMGKQGLGGMYRRRLKI